MFDIIPDEIANEVATRQAMSFFRSGEAGPPSQRAWSIELLPEAGGFDWENLNIFDLDGRLLFREKTLGLRGGMKVSMRTAASKVLGAPVWSASAGEIFDIKAAYTQALNVAKDNRLTPISGEQSLVCYSYPRLGLLCGGQDRAVQTVIDLGDFSLVPVRRSVPDLLQDDVRLCWSPYDSVSNVTEGMLVARWESGSDALLPTPQGPETFTDAVVAANDQVEEKIVELELKGQETEKYCAVAVAQMIVAHYGIAEKQAHIANVMRTNADSGTEPQDQVNGYGILSGGQLTATFEGNPSFDLARREVSQDRPVKDGIPGHARAIAGYRIRGNETWLNIFDPWPMNKGAIYWENWNAPALIHTNYIYVRKTA